ncbi:uncharacterized protein LOC143275379 [Babylonia areolata]|uniref:uncharacterized protein LOC143275379 n=1 Tax=Babylonia areolata TaxID=304850 RepID=UPI003FD696D1
MLPAVVFFSLILLGAADARTTEEWKSRIIYQLLTDRFGPSGAAPRTPCSDLRSYCGGKFSGIQARLPYIQALGANAIWISPFVENTHLGYHGYWAKNIYSVNPEFGTKQELLDLVKTCHDRDIWVMMDVVANHMGYPVGDAYNFTDFVPFNQTWHYHTLCEISDFSNQTQVEICRLAGLPDLNETEPYVHDTLLTWIRDITQEYGFDGYRVDTVVEMPKPFWSDFSASVSDVYLLGEANNGDRTCYTGGYQGPLPAVLNFPLYWAMRRTFTEFRPMTDITDSLRKQRRCFNDTSVLGLFVDNHDFPRFLSLQDDTVLLSNALTYVIFGEGIPIIYYGTEQAFNGDGDPNNRESLWPFYSTSTSLYRFIQSMTDIRKTSRGVKFAARNQVELYVDNDTLVFARGDNSEFLVAVTNVGRRGSVDKTVTGFQRFPSGTEFVNVFDCKDVLTISNGSARLQLSDGMPKVFRQRKRTQPSSAATGKGGNSKLLGMMFVAVIGQFNKPQE